MPFVPAAVHPNDEQSLRDMLECQRPRPLPPSLLPVYQRFARYYRGVTTATLSNIPSALVLVAYFTEEAESARLGVPPDKCAAAYAAELEKAAVAKSASVQAESTVTTPKQKQLAGAK